MKLTFKSRTQLIIPKKAVCISDNDYFKFY